MAGLTKATWYGTPLDQIRHVVDPVGNNAKPAALIGLVGGVISSVHPASSPSPRDIGEAAPRTEKAW